MTTNALRVGNKVGDFSVATFNPISNAFESFSFGDILSQKKWAVLFFYPADFTFVCPTELSDLAKVHKELLALDIEVLAVSTDSQFSHLAWRSKERLLDNVFFPMGADPTGTLARYFGVYNDAQGTAMRGTFIINPEGTLVSIEVSYDSVGRNIDELVRKLKAHVYLYNHPEEVCPSGWQEGDTTLKPGEALVGDVFAAVQEAIR